jgi:Rrf2 family protein
MRVSKRGEYALRTLIHLGRAAAQGQPLVRIATLAEQEDIPVKFLEQILLQLRDEGLLASRRGRNGGYFLHRPMHKIRIGDVIRLIDGPLAPISCASVTAYAPCSCPDEARCGLRLLMLEVRNAIAGILDQRTLADVVRATPRPGRRPHRRPATQKGRR